MELKGNWSGNRVIKVILLAVFIFSSAVLNSACQLEKIPENMGTLKVIVLSSSVSSEEIPADGVEVWVWEKGKFKGTPDYTRITNSIGIVDFTLPAGISFYVSLPPRNPCITLEDAILMCSGGYLTLDSREKFELILQGPKKPRLPVESPVQTMFTTYFSDMALDHSPPKGKYCYTYPPEVLITGGGRHCLFGVAVKEVSISIAIYDIIAKNYFQPPQKYTKVLNPGYFEICESFYPPPGKYEYRIYVGTTLSAVFPFDLVVR